MNRQQILAIVLGSIVALGLSGGAAAGVAAASASDAPADVGDLTALQDEDGEQNETDEEDQETEMGEDGNETTEEGQQNETIPITEALNAAAEETNGTVVGAQLGSGDGGILGGGGDQSVYTVDSLLDNGTHIETQVNATNGSVVSSEQADDGFLEGVFGEDNVPEDPVNLSAIYNATEAVELAQNETDQNGTVTQVTLATGDDNENLTYEVQMAGPDDQETTVVVDAMQDGEGVIDVQNGGMDGGTETATETETEEGNES